MLRSARIAVDKREALTALQDLVERASSCEGDLYEFEQLIYTLNKKKKEWQQQIELLVAEQSRPEQERLDQEKKVARLKEMTRNARLLTACNTYGSENTKKICETYTALVGFADIFSMLPAILAQIDQDEAKKIQAIVKSIEEVEEKEAKAKQESEEEPASVEERIEEARAKILRIDSILQQSEIARPYVESLYAIICAAKVIIKEDRIMPQILAVTRDLQIAYEAAKDQFISLEAQMASEDYSRHRDRLSI